MAAKVRERRMASRVLEVRSDSSELVVEGYASTTGQPYSMGWYDESIARAAFKRTLGQSPDVRYLVNHDGLPLARTTSGTLELAEDSTGLFSRARLDRSDPDVQALEPKLRRGDLNQMSFGFYVTEQHWSDDYAQREIQAVDLNDGDVSIVTYPANPNTSVGIRAGRAPGVEAILGALRALEQRSAGPDEISGVLQRALGYLASVDAIVDQAQADVAAELGVPNPDTDDDDAARAAVSAEIERRRRLLALL